ncbi:MAG TPA: hypothetical protein VHF50_00900 [Solirubrobacterales bacterium]|nr:hypothetical protein [Solirubrobacterales bacterium]
MRDDPKEARRICRSAVVGSGAARFEIAFPEQPPIVVRSPIVIFNAGTERGETRLLVHAVITVPVPTAVVTHVTITKKGGGINAVARVPVIASGSGSLLDFKIRLGRRYTYEDEKRSLLTARCPDGVFEVSASKALFRNEAAVPHTAAQTILKTRVLAPCTPKG